MKKTIILLLTVVLGITGLKAQLSFGEAENLNAGWKFMLGDSDQATKISYNANRWQNVTLPHDWSVKGVLSPGNASCTGYLPGGIAWYRKNIHIPASKANEKVYIYFEGVYNRSKVYVNEQLVGERPNGYISFAYDITNLVKFGEDNLIAVRVDHSRSADSRWYTGSGIYRDVWLVTANPIHIAQWGVYAYPEVKSAKSAVLNIETEIDNESAEDANLSVVNELRAADGKVVASNTKKLKIAAGGSSTLKQSLNIKNPGLWNIDNPTLYTLETKVYEKGNLIDQNSMQTGFRTFTFDPNKGFALNGTWMKMKGVCIHHDSGVLGAASYKEVWRKRLLNLKEIGVNAIRTSHNPQATHLYELCDELGLLVMNEAYDEWEFPKRKWLEGWNVGTPGFEGSYDFFEAWGEKDLEDMVKRDRNHVSIFAWSIGNEVDYPNDPYSHPILDGDGGFTQPMFGGYKKDAPDAMRLGDIAERLAKVVRKYDPSRAVTAGLAGVAMSNETGYPAALDIAGYNYTESRYETDHVKYPDRVIYGSENRHDMAAWKDVRDKEHIFGQFLWTGIDYLGESGRWPSRGFYSGLLDLGGNIKPRGYFRKGLWASEPTAYIGTYPTPGRRGSRAGNQDVWSALEAEQAGGYVERVPSMDAWPIWNYNDGQSIRVVTYTNAAKAQLELNGKTVGQLKDYNDDTGIIYWDIPYESGKLEVIGFDKDNNEIVRESIESSGRSHALKIVAADEQIQKSGGVAKILLQVVDEDGKLVMLSDDEVTCRVNGPGRLLGLEASNNSDMGNYTDNAQRVYHGHLVAYIQSTTDEGTIRVSFTAPWLEGAQTEIVIE
ncbi:MAG TPA: glycoside hydrolase family 2 TIM barrel-domain containing protein [Paludibacter sp.]|nr:glycoside hydrolase family 2 TIM barrel-domain containing protein [Paludibacter sp.]